MKIVLYYCDCCRLQVFPMKHFRRSSLGDTQHACSDDCREFLDAQRWRTGGEVFPWNDAKPVEVAS